MEYRSDGGGLADRVGANRIRRRGGASDGFEPARPPAAAADDGSQRGPRCGQHPLFAFTAAGLGLAIPLRFVTGIFLAGVYPVGMKLTASWSQPARRGRAFGILIGALTLGSALPHLIGGLGDLPWRTVMATAAGCAVAGAFVAATRIKAGPQLGAATLLRPYPRYALHMSRERGPRLVNLGYFGHMWELYALWTWLPAFLIAGTAVRTGETPSSVGLLAFTAVGVAGVAGCLLGGWAADRWADPRRPSGTDDQRRLLPGVTVVLRRGTRLGAAARHRLGRSGDC